MVIVVHAAQIVFHPSPLATILSKGAYGVQLFFIVSALTLFLSYEQRKIVDGRQTNYFFLIRRFFRIAPAFYLAIALYTCAFFLKNYILGTNSVTFDWIQLLTFSAFLGVLYPASMYLLPFGGWTVQVEMFFYIFIPFLFKLLSTKKRAIYFFVVSWLGYLALERILMSLETTAFQPYLVFQNQIPVFALGIILYHILRENTAVVKRSYLFSIELGVYLGLIFLLSKWTSLLSETILISLFFSGLILLMSSKKIPLLQNKITMLYGKVSYSLYLWHFIIILFFWYIYRVTSHFWGAPQLLSFVIIYFTTALIGLLVSWFSFNYLEKPGINLGKKIIQNYTQNLHHEKN